MTARAMAPAPAGHLALPAGQQHRHHLTSQQEEEEAAGNVGFLFVADGSAGLGVRKWPRDAHSCQTSCNSGALTAEPTEAVEAYSNHSRLHTNKQQILHVQACCRQYNGLLLLLYCCCCRQLHPLAVPVSPPGTLQCLWPQPGQAGHPMMVSTPSQPLP